MEKLIMQYSFYQDEAKQVLGNDQELKHLCDSKGFRSPDSIVENCTYHGGNGCYYKEDLEVVDYYGNFLRIESMYVKPVSPKVVISPYGTRGCGRFPNDTCINIFTMGPVTDTFRWNYECDAN